MFRQLAKVTIKTFLSVIHSFLGLILKLLKTLTIWTILLRNFLVFLIPFVLFLTALLFFTYVLKADFQKYLELVQVLIWPFTLLLTLFFFRKVITYLFFSMNEFNFFGSKGVLKNVTDVIEERVESRFQSEKDEAKRQEELNSMEQALSKAVESRDTHESRAGENLKLAEEMFHNYRELSKKYSKVQDELDNYRRKERARLDRIQKIKEKRYSRPRNHYEDERLEKAGQDDSGQPKGASKSTNDKME